MIFFAVGHLWKFEEQIYPSYVHETSENSRTDFPWCLTTSYRFSNENIEKKNLWKILHMCKLARSLRVYCECKPEIQVGVECFLSLHVIGHFLDLALKHITCTTNTHHL